jgi:RNA polymerase sigma factor (sigma-70 family)
VAFARTHLPPLWLNHPDVGRHLWDMEAMATTSAGRVDPDVVARVERALAGDEASFAWIVETFSADMTQVCMVVCGDLGLADDAVAAAWPIAWRKLDGLRDPERLRPWLISIAANQARQMLRARRRRAVREIAVAIPDAPAANHDWNAEIDLANALAGLDPDDRALLALRYVAGFDSNELARVTGLSPSGTRARLARLLDRMRRELRDD